MYAMQRPARNFDVSIPDAWPCSFLTTMCCVVAAFGTVHSLYMPLCKETVPSYTLMVSSKIFKPNFRIQETQEFLQSSLSFPGSSVDPMVNEASSGATLNGDMLSLSRMRMLSSCSIGSSALGMVKQFGGSMIFRNAPKSHSQGDCL